MTRSTKALATLLLIALAVACDGVIGPKGDPGDDGASGSSGVAGNDGADGPSGVDGATGDEGPPGNDGLPGDDGLPGGNGLPGSDGNDGLSTGSVVVSVRDADSGAVVIGAIVTAEPTGDTMPTNAAGVVTFAALPVGFHQFAVAAPGLTVVDDLTVTPTDAAQTTTAWLSLVAGGAEAVVVALPRLNLDTINLVRMHVSTLADDVTPNPAYTNANCVGCHGDRTGEQSSDPTIPPFHAVNMHALQSCTFCHGTVDLAESSGATLRQQVSVAATCDVCHANYPNILP